MTEETRIETISSRNYNQICDVNFESSSDTQYKCFVACERKGIKQICTFDLSEDLKLRKLNNKIHHGQKMKSEISINYTQDLDPNYKVMIDYKCRQVVLSNGKENCLVEYDGDYQTQRLIQKTEDKDILLFKQDYENGGFFVVCRKKFDKYMRIYHTNISDFKFRFERVVEAKLILTHDFHIQEVIDENGFTRKEVRLVSMEDDHFLIDRVDFKQSSIMDKLTYSDFRYQYFTISQISAFSFSWPYVCFSGINNFICIISSFDKSKMTRVEVAPKDQCVAICKTFITETDDLFILISCQDIYKLYQIDLNEYEKAQKNGSNSAIQPIFLMQYSHESVGNNPIDQIKIRGSSRKDTIDINQKLQVFFLHGSSIYCWIKKDESFDEPLDLETLIKVSECSSQIYSKDDGHFVFLKCLKNERQEVVCQDLIEVTCNFSTFSQKTIYEEMSKQNKIKCVKFDAQENSILILTKSKGIQDGKLNIIYSFKVFDVDTLTVITDINLKDEERIGRLKSGLFSLIDGHMYFSNDLIKIRYDLIYNSTRNQTFLSEDMLFDNYDDCFKLDKSELVRSKTPLISLNGNRFCYIISDKFKRHPIDVFIIPFLHDKRIELGKDNQKNIFYTAIETPNQQEEVYLDELEASRRNGTPLNIQNIINYDKIKQKKQTRKKSILQDTLNLGIQGAKFGGQGLQSFGEVGLSQFTGNVKPSLMQPKIQKDQFTSIAAFDQEQHKIKIYNQLGLLINEIDFSDKFEEYGDPIATSQNGQIFIFKKTDEQIEDEKLESEVINPEKQDQRSQSSEVNSEQEFLTIHVVQMTIYGMVWIKSINLQTRILSWIKENSNKNKIDEFTKFNQWLKEPNFEKMRKHLEIKCQINDQKDVLVEIKDTKIDQLENLKDNKSKKLYRSVFYWEAAEKIQEKQTGMLDIQNLTKLNPIQQQEQQKIDRFVFQTPGFSCVKMAMNNEYIFKWEVKNVYIFNLHQKINNFNGTKMQLSIDPNDDKSSTKSIICGSDANTIVIVIENTEIKTDTVLTWNIKNNIQEEAYEMKDKYIVIWDIDGCPYLVTDDQVYFTAKRCMITAYEIKGLVDQLILEKDTTTFDHTKGHKIDFKNHNWVLLKDCLSLSFSYLTFVMQDKIENNDPCMDGNVFDITPYNYIFNKNTCFIQGDFVKNDHQMLGEVLKMISDVNPDHLQILNYNQEVYENEEDDNGDPRKNSALHQAVRSGNQRSTDLLLDQLSKLDYNSSRNYVSIFEQLVEQKGFVNYFSKLSNQTELMKKKMILKCKSQMSETIIHMTDSPCEYIDNKFFTQEMNEPWKKGKEGKIDDAGFQSYPVNIVALRVNWILQHPAGKAFLSKILLDGDLSLYEIKTLQMIIEFLFKEYKKLIWLFVCPLYVVSQVTFESLLSANDAYVSNLFKHRQDGRISSSFLIADNDDNAVDTAFRTKLITMSIFNLIAMIIQLIQLLAQFKSSGLSYFKKLFGILDCLYIFFTINIYLKILQTYEKDLEESDFIDKVKNFRTIAVFGTIVLYMKATYFFSLIDAVAPLVDIIFRIIFDIKWFMAIMAFYILMLGKCFDLLGTSQIEFDNLSEEDIDAIPYSIAEGTKYQATFNRFWFVAQFALGGPDGADAFEVGDASMKYQLFALYAFSCVIIVVHLLNMLIAIMGNTFGERTAVGSLIMTKDHLRFVMDNWELRKVAFDLPKIKYIICAFAAEEDEDDGILGEIKTTLDTMNKEIQLTLRDNQAIIKDTQMVVNSNKPTSNHDDHKLQL